MVFVEEVTDLDKALSVVELFRDNRFLTFARSDESINGFVTKQLQHGHMLVAYNNNMPQGFVCFYCNDTKDKIGYITAIAIDEELGMARGGILFRLAREAIGIGIKAGMESVRIEVDKDNLHARTMYEKVGFKYEQEEGEHSSYMVIMLETLKDNMKIDTGK